MNRIFVHGKVTKKAEMKLVKVNGEANAMAVFTVADLGLPSHQVVEPTYFVVNYPRDAACLIAKYLVEGKEINVVGSLCQKFGKGPDGTTKPRLYLKADAVELLPVFATQCKTEEAAYGEN